MNSSEILVQKLLKYSDFLKKPTNILFFTAKVLVATGRPFVHGVKFEIIDLKDSSFKHTFMIEKASNYLFENDEKIGNREGVGGITLKDVPILCGGSRHPGPLGGMNLFKNEIFSISFREFRQIFFKGLQINFSPHLSVLENNNYFFLKIFREII